VAEVALMFAALGDPGHGEIVRALLQAGARADAVAGDGSTARSLAAKHGHAHLVDALRRRP
jgi:ankyrin repeat protein